MNKPSQKNPLEKRELIDNEHAFEIVMGRPMGKKDHEFMLQTLANGLDSESYLVKLLQSEEFRRRIAEHETRKSTAKSDVVHYFNHIPKTGGMSLVAGVAEHLAPHRVMRANFGQFGQVGISQIARLQFLSGHLGQTPLRQFPQLRWKMYSLWRQPADWWQSSYHQCRRALSASSPQFQDSPDVQLAYLPFSDWIRLDIHRENSIVSQWLMVGANCENKMTESPIEIVEQSLTQETILEFANIFESIMATSRVLELTNHIRKSLKLAPLANPIYRNNFDYVKSLTDDDAQFLKSRHPLDFWFDDAIMRSGGVWKR